MRGLALGHACLRYTRDGPRPAISAIAADFQLQLTRLGRTQADQSRLILADIGDALDRVQTPEARAAPLARA